MPVDITERATSVALAYVGATARLDPGQAFDLGSLWAYQPKLDGCYAVARLDAEGRITSVISRTGRELPEGAELHGILAGPPGSVLVGELDAHTESGEAAHRAQGFRRLHLFDCLSLGSVDLRSQSYLERWGALHRAQSMLEADGAARVASWTDDRYGRPHALSGGRFAARIPLDLRRLPIVPLLRSPSDARSLWADVERGDLEGLVAVRLDARAGAPGSKRKIKITDTLDCRVIASDRSTLRVQVRAGSTQQAWRDRPTFSVASTKQEAPGTIVEVAHHGYYQSGEPRFARVVRARKDLA